MLKNGYQGALRADNGKEKKRAGKKLLSWGSGTFAEIVAFAGFGKGTFAEKVVSSASSQRAVGRCGFDSTGGGGFQVSELVGFGAHEFKANGSPCLLPRAAPQQQARKCSSKGSRRAPTAETAAAVRGVRKSGEVNNAG